MEDVGGVEDTGGVDAGGEEAGGEDDVGASEEEPPEEGTGTTTPPCTVLEPSELEVPAAALI